MKCKGCFDSEPKVRLTGGTFTALLSNVFWCNVIFYNELDLTDLYLIARYYAQFYFIPLHFNLFHSTLIYLALLDPTLDCTCASILHSVLLYAIGLNWHWMRWWN